MCSVHKFKKCIIIGPCEDYGCATIRPLPEFDAEYDISHLAGALTKSTKSEAHVIEILCKRSLDQRLAIRRAYSDRFGRDIANDIKTCFSGDFEAALMAMIQDPVFADAAALQKAMKRVGTKEPVLTEILANRNPEQIHEIRNCYRQEFNRDLDKDIEDETSGGFRLVLSNLLKGTRRQISRQQQMMLAQQGTEFLIDRADAVYQAELLANATSQQKKSAGDDNPFIRIICLNHVHQLRAVCEEYLKRTRTDLYSATKTLSGDLGKGLHSVLMSVCNRPKFFAEKIHNSVKGLGTDEATLTRVLISRSEVDLEDIKNEYFTQYNKSLESAVSADTSGEFRKLLLAVIQGNHK